MGEATMGGDPTKPDQEPKQFETRHFSSDEDGKYYKAPLKRFYEQLNLSTEKDGDNEGSLKILDSTGREVGTATMAVPEDNSWPSTDLAVLPELLEQFDRIESERELQVEELVKKAKDLPPLEDGGEDWIEIRKIAEELDRLGVRSKWTKEQIGE